MAADFDLSQLKGPAGNNGVNTGKDTIDTTGGKIQRRGNYVSANQARGNRPSQPEVDPIFDTPPTFKVGGAKDKNVQSLNEDSSVVSYGTPPKRTPIQSGNPKQTVVTHSKPTDDVPDPAPLRVVDNVKTKFNETAEKGGFVPFDPKSLPKKKQEMGDAEAEDMANLEKAVNKEMESISERIHALTEKQHEEFMDAKQEGKYIAPPLTDEQLAAQEEARIAGNADEEDSSEEVPQEKHFIIDGDEQEIETKPDTSVIDAFANDCLETIRYIDNHVTAKDYFTRVMHARSYLEKKKIYSEIWAIVMYNHENESAVHPFLVAKKSGITNVIECNIDSIKGVHTLDPNDTIESLYVNFLHGGYLYEYIDYLAKHVVLKLPTDMPTAENALKMANKKLGENVMSENNIPSIEETEAEITKSDELDEFINKDEAEALYGSDYHVEETITAPEIEETFATTTGEDGINKSYTIDGPTEETTAKVTYADAVEETTEEEPVETETPIEEDNSITINKEYEGGEAYQQASSDDLAKDLENELNVDVDSGRSEEEMLDELRSAVKQNIPTIKNRINLKNFKISDTPISASKVTAFSIADVNQADWVMPNAERVITVKGLSGPELFAMNPQNSNKNRINTFRQIYGIIYKHIVSKKPKTFDEWLKVTRFSDIDHIYAALHRATFSGSNFVHYECPECQHVFIQDYDFEDMVQYRDDKAKEKIHHILNSGNSSIAGYNVKLSQISDNYVIGLKDPSIWNMVMETAALSEQFLSKYEDLMDTMSFIDSIYVIDRQTQELKPVSFDYDKNDPAKSTARKIMILSEIIRTLSSDNYFDLRNQIAQLFSSSNDMTYKIPAAKCPKCGHEFHDEQTGGMQMLFTRHQLGALGVI